MKMEHLNIKKSSRTELVRQLLFGTARDSTLLPMVDAPVYITIGGTICVRCLLLYFAYQLRGDKGSRPQVETISGACHKVFRTRAQAEAFIEDWKESFSDVFRRALKQMMDQGHRPNNMKLQLEAILSRTSPLADDVEDSETFGVDGLSLEE